MTLEDLIKKGNKLHKGGKLDEAEKIYNGILNRHPDNPGVLFLLGTLYLQKRCNGLAINLLESALSRQEFSEAFNNLGSAYKAENFNDMALRAFHRARELNEKDPDVCNNLSTIYINEGQPAQCIDWADEAIKLDSDHPNAHWNRGLAYLELGEWERGWEGYEWGFKSKDRLSRDYKTDTNNATRWDGSPGKTVVVYGEQGVGDEIMFSSCIPDLISVSKKVIFDCHPRMVALMRRSFNVECYGTRKESSIDWIKFPIDNFVAIGSLPGFFRKKSEDFPGTPYLLADSVRVEHFREKISAVKPGLRVGVTWTGGRKKTRIDLRSIPIEQLERLFNIPGTSFVSLQYTPEAAAEAEKFDLPHWQDVINDLDELTALTKACDLVISVCQTQVHMAGALGVSCLCLTPSRPAWRYGMFGNMPWYGSVTNIRQESDGDWAGVIEAAAARLLELTK
jgi:hypothetical protein